VKPRKSSIAGRWYPGTAAALAAAVDGCLANASGDEVVGDLVAIAAPHAGLQYSGPVAAHAYRLLGEGTFDAAVVIGPSHFVAFDGVALAPEDEFETPLGVVHVDGALASALRVATPLVRVHATAHGREHSIEMQLPFLQRVAPGLPIVPLLMGVQSATIVRGLADALVACVTDRRTLLVASTDLSHYHDAGTAARMDGVVLDGGAFFDAATLRAPLDREPGHACGGGPLAAVMRAARAIGASDGIVLDYGDSGDVTGDKSSVVGYMAAAFGTFRAVTDREETAA
jgi:MEMO1 family protein